MAKITSKDLAALGLSVKKKESSAAPLPKPEPIVTEPQYFPESHNPTNFIDNDPSLEDAGFRAFSFESSAELLSAIDPYIRKQIVHLHPWQLEISEDLCIANKPNDLNPLKYCVCAANGSGKDKYVIAPFVVWFLLTKKRSRVIITSSSGTQLTSQTETYIADFARACNELFGCEMFKIRQRYIRCNLSGSEVRMFATDEAGRAEGYHPLEPTAEMAIIINEAKSVSEEIFGALRRCTGYNYWLEVSTPGEPHGHFYKAFTDPSLKYKTRHVTSFDCPHLSESEREIDKIELGEHSLLYRSKHLALFTSIGGQVIITPELLERCKQANIKPTHQDWPIRFGIDLAAGGAENAIVGTKGNVIVEKFFFREYDTTLTADMIDNWLTDKIKKYPEMKSKAYDKIFADDGNIGHSIIDMLVRLGWTNIVRVNNQNSSSNKAMYSNKGAENWSRMKRLFEEELIPPPEDAKLLTQLSSRHYKQTDSGGGKVRLMSKKEEIAAGRPSPDRADAYVLSYSDVTVDSFTFDKKESEKTHRNYMNSEAFRRHYEDKFTFGEGDTKQRKLDPIHGSLQVALKLEKENYG